MTLSKHREGRRLLRFLLFARRNMPSEQLRMGAFMALPFYLFSFLLIPHRPGTVVPQ